MVKPLLWAAAAQIGVATIGYYSARRPNRSPTFATDCTCRARGYRNVAEPYLGSSEADVGDRRVLAASRSKAVSSIVAERIACSLFIGARSQ